MNVPDALHCSGCGRELGLEPVGDRGRLTCPDCRSPLRVFAGDLGAIHDCETCGGQFVEHGLLRELVEERERFADHLNPAQKLPPGPSRVRYVPCPACGTLMNRKNFGGQSGVIVDICKKHGTWFDSGELPRVLAFIEGGGLERERQRHLEEKSAARHAAALAGSNLTSPSAANLRGDPVGHGTGLADFLHDLFLMP